MTIEVTIFYFPWENAPFCHDSLLEHVDSDRVLVGLHVHVGCLVRWAEGRVAWPLSARMLAWPLRSGSRHGVPRAFAPRVVFCLCFSFLSGSFLT